MYKVVTPDECIALADQVGDLGSITLHPLLAGMPPELGWESLELFESEVLPRLGGRGFSPPDASSGHSPAQP